MNSIARMESVVMKKLSYNLNVTSVGQLINKGNISSELENTNVWHKISSNQLA